MVARKTDLKFSILVGSQLYAMQLSQGIRVVCVPGDSKGRGFPNLSFLNPIYHRFYEGLNQ
jgi:hypothetical protein